MLARGWRRECNNYINTKKLILPKAACLFYKIPSQREQQHPHHSNSTDASAAGYWPSRLDHQVLLIENTYSTMMFWTALTGAVQILKKPNHRPNPKQANNNKKNPRKTEAKNKIWQYCFSSSLPLGLKRKILQQAIPAVASDSGSQTTQLINAQ